MGYNTRFSGEIRIDPPLNWNEIKDSPWLPENAFATYADVKLTVVEETIDTDDGVLIRRSATAIEPFSDEAYKGYNIIDTVNAVIAAFPGHQFSGRFDCEGEEAGDLWRLAIRDGRAVKIEPRIVWPDEEPRAFPAYMTAAALAAVLDDMAGHVEDHDSFDGTITYEISDRKTDEYDVTAFYRVGNSMGQGGSRLIRGKGGDQ